jgi:hypothetical protein
MDDLCSAALRHLVGRQALVFGDLLGEPATVRYADSRE